MYEVTMPKLSDSMEDGKIIEWKVKAGDAVCEGDVLAEVESDKAVMELECFRGGVVVEIKQGNDAEVKVGAVIAVIDDASAVTTPEPRPKPVEAGASIAAEPKVDRKPKPAKAEAPEPARPVPTSAAKRAEKPAPIAAERIAGERVAISPYARKLAEEHGVDLAKVKGTGPGGRITAQDLELARKAAAGARPAEKAASAPGAGREPVIDGELPALDVTEDEAEVEEASYRLRTQARRVTDVKHVIPHFYMTRAADVSALLERKAEFKENFGATVTHLIAFACLKALAEHPEVNRSYDHGRVIKWKGVNLGIAVDTEQGLTVAVLRNAQDLPFAELVTKSNELVERARSGKLTASERRHASFTISNLGMHDIEHFEPIINPPSAVTLGVAAALPQAIVRGDEIHIGKLMRLTASCDHRIIEGATAARFLATLAGLLENPEKLME